MAAAWMDDAPFAPLRTGRPPHDAHSLAITGESAVYATFLLLAVVMHHWLLCFMHNKGISVSVARVAMAELIIYIACVPLLLARLSLRSLIAVFVALGLSGLLALLRGGYFDAKAARDLLIPLVFVWAGRSYGQNGRSLDRPLLIVTGVVVAIGLVQAVIPDLYNRVFNTFSYYVSLGGISSSSAQVAGQSVTLNGLRPEGIGRTLLPQLLGAQRVASVFLEPVSLGNFAVILLAWGLAKPGHEWRTAAWFIGSALVCIVLADSRFGFYMTGLLVLLRLVLHGRAHAIGVVFPAIGACALLLLATYMPGEGDNLVGRMTVSGQYLLTFNEWNLLGLRDFATNFGDMGYAYVFSRFSLPGAVLMWVCVYALPLHDETARRFRTFMSAYVTLILCVSGTSLFALKTAGVMWFALGAMSMRRPDIDLGENT
ncbi:MAG: polysaccharide polymerase [Rhizobacter sp.]|nr:polysaccharide polymerase [Rhizobacter sp.]